MPATTRPRCGPRERLAEVGAQALSEAELLALLLGTGSAAEPVEVTAARLLEEHGGVFGIASAGLGELSESRNVGIAKAGRVVAAIELGARVAIASLRTSPIKLGASHAVDAWARPRLAALAHEELWMLAVDGQNALRAARRVAQGGLHGLHVAARDPLRLALREAASAFILVHNHPSGDPTPSKEDVEFTERVARAADVVGTPLLDHVIVARGGYTSMLDRSILPDAAPEVGKKAVLSAPVSLLVRERRGR